MSSYTERLNVFFASLLRYTSISVFLLLLLRLGYPHFKGCLQFWKVLKGSFLVEQVRYIFSWRFTDPLVASLSKSSSLSR